MRRNPQPLLLLAAALVSAPAAAQYRQFTPPGTLLLSAEPRAEAARRRAEEARWTLGKLRLAPDLGLQDVGYVDNVFDAPEGTDRESDFRGTAMAGLEAFLFLGSKAMLAFHGRPEYVWWQDQEDLRELLLSYGASWFGDFNRLQLELVAERLEEQGFVNDELRVPLDLTTDQLSGRFELDFSGPFALLGGAAAQQVRLPQATPGGAEPLALTPLDRDETTFDLTLAYQLGNGLEVGLGAELSEVDFENDLGGRSNEGTSPSLALRFLGNRADFDLRVLQRRLEFTSDALGDSEEVTGAARAGWRVRTRSDVALYGSRQLVYSALDSSALYTNEFYGAGFGWGQLEGEDPRPRLAVFAETGRDRYESTGGSLAGRADDLVNYGLTVQVPLRRWAVFEVGAIESEIDSNRDPFDSSYTILRTAFTLEPIGIGRR